MTMTDTEQDFVVEVQTRGWCSDGAGLARIDRLVTSRVVRLGSALDVRRQRHRAVTLKVFERLDVQLELEQVFMSADVASLDSAG